MERQRLLASSVLASSVLASSVLASSVLASSVLLVPSSRTSAPQTGPATPRPPAASSPGCPLALPARDGSSPKLAGTTLGCDGCPGGQQVLRRHGALLGYVIDSRPAQYSSGSVFLPLIPALPLAVLMARLIPSGRQGQGSVAGRQVHKPQDDAHIFCAREQLGSELASLLEFVLRLLRTFGLTELGAAPLQGRLIRPHGRAGAGSGPGGRAGVLGGCGIASRRRSRRCCIGRAA
jgi:hypothetical protein